MDLFGKIGIEPGRAICYSGYRDGQSPHSGIFPSYEEVKQDLLMLREHWKYLRIYDCTQHAERVLEVIRSEKLPFRVMLGAFIDAEISNPNCPWGATYSEKKLRSNRKRNKAEIDKLIELANQYPEIIFSVSVGNEATVDWTDHLVPVERILEFVRKIKKHAIQPVTFCENYVPWLDKIKGVAAEIDFISIHTYPVWEYKSIDEAIDYTKSNYYDVVGCYPDKPVVITEAGWTTKSNGRGMPPEHASEQFQQIYLKQLSEWTNSEGIPCFVFEAFDESWKGSDDPLEPEKHWGLFTTDRLPKQAIQNL